MTNINESALRSINIGSGYIALVAALALVTTALGGSEVTSFTESLGYSRAQFALGLVVTEVGALAIPIVSILSSDK